MKDIKTFSLMLGDKELAFEFGRLADQADGACTVRCGDTVVFATTVISKTPPREGVDFLPLMVNFQERYYAAGSIKSSRFMKREARPADDKILISRLIDRSIRPLFPKYVRQDIQVMIYPLSYDGIEQHDMLGALATSAALAVSKIPFEGPTATVRVGMINGEFVLNPTTESRKKSDLDLVVSATEENVVMIEAGANEVPEEKMLEAIAFGKKWAKKICDFIKQIQAEIGEEKMELVKPDSNEELENFVRDNFGKDIDNAIFEYPVKLERMARKREIITKIEEKVKEVYGDEANLNAVEPAFHSIFKEKIRSFILNDEKRIAGRKLTEIRPITTEINVLPRTHGSAIFTRGETQGLTVVTLGGPGDQLITEGIEGEEKHRFFHYYSFPPFSVGECSNRLSTGNREIGHGALAQRAIEPILPPVKEFAYTIMANTDIMASNGSSSMAATCGTTLALMDAGVPIKAPVSGIAMGLMTDETGNYKILSDIQDDEDFGGDMDFKVTGTTAGITAIQMDIKIKGLSEEIFEKALAQAKQGRLEILERMLATIAEPRKELSPYAPSLITMQINPEKIRDVIGKGGETINKIIEETGVEIDIEQDGTVVITAKDQEGGKRAQEWVINLTADPELDRVYNGKVVRIEEYGAFVEIMNGHQGLLHVSLISGERIPSVKDVLKVGQAVKVKLVEIDNLGRLKFSMKDVPQD